jgi:hypothetical protein
MVNQSEREHPASLAERIAVLERQAARSANEAAFTRRELRRSEALHREHVRWRRIERILSAGIVTVTVVALWSGGPSAQTPQRSINERVDDLEKRVGGLMGSEVGGPVRFRAPFEIVGKQGKILMSVKEGAAGGVMELGQRGAGLVTLGVGDSGAGFMLITHKKGSDAIGLGGRQGGPAGVSVISESDGSVQAFLGLDDKNDGRVALGKSASGSVEIGIGRSGAGFTLLRDKSGALAASVGRLDNGAMAFTVHGAGEKPVASLTADPKLGGRTNVMNAQGLPVGGLLAQQSGGGLVLTGATGGDSLVDLGIGADGGGTMRVYGPGGGSPRASVVAEDNVGKVIAFNSSGEPVAALFSGTSGQGRLQLSKGAQVIVEAGMTVDGVGVVRALPGGGPGGALGIPHQIIGWKGSK